MCNVQEGGDQSVEVADTVKVSSESTEFRTYETVMIVTFTRNRRSLYREMSQSIMIVISLPNRSGKSLSAGTVTSDAR